MSEPDCPVTIEQALEAQFSPELDYPPESRIVPSEETLDPERRISSLGVHVFLFVEIVKSRFDLDRRSQLR
jgi:hypothetical protein